MPTAHERLVTFARQANGRFTHPIKDTSTCPAESHSGGGIRWLPATAALAATALVGIAIGVVGSPDQTDPVAVVSSASPSPAGTNFLPFATPTPTSGPSSPSPTPLATPDPTPTPEPAPTAAPLPAPTAPPPVVVVVQTPQGGSGARQTVTRSETTRVVREIVTVTAPPAPPVVIVCMDPGRHLGRTCRVVR